MTARDPVEAIARAVLYEGYLLYPYTRSAAKNQVRWTFGGVYPPAWAADPSVMRTECLLVPGPACRVRVQVRCLHVVERTAAGDPPWQEAMERTVLDAEHGLDQLLGAGREVAFALPAGAGVDGGVHRRWHAIDGVVAIRARPAGVGGAVVLTVRVENRTDAPPGLDREAAVLRTLASTHTVLRAREGAFASLADPPAGLEDAAAACANLGTWPVLVGEAGSRDTVLSSPIILEDHPRVAEESPGDLFDGTEIDEILTLRILTLTDDEKDELRRTDERGRRLLERTESLTADDLLKLHGTLRGLRALEDPE